MDPRVNLFVRSEPDPNHFVEVVPAEQKRIALGVAEAAPGLGFDDVEIVERSPHPAQDLDTSTMRVRGGVKGGVKEELSYKSSEATAKDNVASLIRIYSHAFIRTNATLQRLASLTALVAAALLTSDHYARWFCLPPPYYC
jgi:hypothetical protein